VALQELGKEGSASSHAMRKARLEVLASAHVIATTLTGATAADGREVIASSGSRGRVILPPFDAVIIDEAGQSGELGALIPIVTASLANQSSGRQPVVVLVGDPKQLPATVLSRRAEAAGFGRSLLERLVRAVEAERAAGAKPIENSHSKSEAGPGIASASTSGARTARGGGSRSLAQMEQGALLSGPWSGGHFAMLREQHRMLPSIREFPSKRFYASLLRDAKSVERRQALRAQGIAASDVNSDA